MRWQQWPDRRPGWYTTWERHWRGKWRRRRDENRLNSSVWWAVRRSGQDTSGRDNNRVVFRWAGWVTDVLIWRSARRWSPVRVSRFRFDEANEYPLLSGCVNCILSKICGFAFHQKNRSGSERQLERAFVVAGIFRDNDSSKCIITFRQGQDTDGSSKPGNKHMRLRVISLAEEINDACVWFHRYDLL